MPSWTPCSGVAGSILKAASPGRRRGGRSPARRPPAQAPIEAAAANAQQAQQALDAVERTGDSLSESLQASLERLTPRGQSRHGRFGAPPPPGRRGHHRRLPQRRDPVDLELAFQVARQEAGALVLGQEEFLDGLLIAFKRPLCGRHPGGPPPVPGSGLRPPRHGTPQRAAVLHRLFWGGRAC